MSFWKYVWGLYLRFWPTTLRTGIGYGCVMVFDAMMPAFVAKNLADVVMGGPESAYVWLGAIALAYILVAAFHCYEWGTWELNASWIRKWIHMDLYKQVQQNKNFTEFKKNPPEYYTDAIYNIQDNWFDMALGTPRQVLALVMVFIINAVMFMKQSALVTVCILIPALIVIGYTIYIALRVRALQNTRDMMRVALRKNVAESLSNIHSIRANACVQDEYDIIEKINCTYATHSTKTYFIQCTAGMVHRITTSLGVLCAIWIGMKSYYAGKLELDMLVFLVVSMTSIMKMVQSLHSPIVNFMNKIASVMRSFDIIYGNPETPYTGMHRINKIKTIDVKNLSFSYDCTQILSDISFHISRGEHIGINGRSGTGKTTLFNLILGLYKSNSESVFINQIPLSELSILNLRKRIFMSVQNAPLINRTLRENIKFTNPKISDAHMIRAAKQAEIHEFIISLPNGYDTVAGNIGSCLSGGQINRIMLARAFASGADVLLLDEPTAALDAKTEEKIIKTIQHDFRDKTVVIISHNKKVLNAMDKVVNFKNSGTLC